MMRNIMMLLLVGLGILVSGCSRKDPPDPHAAQGASARAIVGAGATFPYPLYAKWGYSYEKESRVRVNYQSIGSGGGIQQIKARTVDFGASDAPLQVDELKAAGLIQFPLVMGGVVPVVRLQGVGDAALSLDGTTLADMYLGKIKKWNDPRIAALNPGMSLPDQDVTVIHRADGSGTTWIFTNYLSKVSKEWEQKVGNDKAVSWPVGAGGKGNEGVAVYVQRVDGALGYVEHAYAIQNKLATIRLKNAAGHVVAAGRESFQAAASNADWKNAPGFYVVLTDQPGDGTWPITGASFILMHEKPADLSKTRAMLEFFDYAYSQGNSAEELGYVPMPGDVVELVRSMWTERLGEAAWKSKRAQ